MLNIKIGHKMSPDYRGLQRPVVTLQAPSRFYQLSIAQTQALVRELLEAIEAADAFRDLEGPNDHV